MIKTLLTALLFAGAIFGQCGAGGKLITNPLTGLPDCTGKTGAGTGTVTSVGLVGTANQVTVSGATPIIGTGTWTLSIPSTFVIPGTMNKYTFTAPATGATITILDGKTFTLNNSITFAGTDSTTMTFPGTSQTIPGANQTNTLGASFTWDMSAAGVNGLRLPNVAGAAPTTAGVAAYDTTNKNFHFGANSVDNIVGMFLASALPANGDCIQASVVSSVVRLATTGSACGAGGGGAPINATYLTLTSNGTLTNYEILTAGSGISFATTGAGGTLTVTADVSLSVPNTWLAKQIFQKNSNVAGENSTPTTVPTASLVAGDKYINSTTFLRGTYNGSAFQYSPAFTAATTPCTATQVWIGSSTSGLMGCASTTGGVANILGDNAPVISLPVIANLTNMTHNHSNANGGGQLDDTAVLTANKEGNGTKFQMFTGSNPATNDCAKFDVNHNIISAGAACSSGAAISSGVIPVGNGTTIIDSTLFISSNRIDTGGGTDAGIDFQGTYLGVTHNRPLFARYFKTDAVTYADLPTCNGGNEGYVASITDSPTVTFNANTSPGGGANHIRVQCNGTIWAVY